MHLNVAIFLCRKFVAFNVWPIFTKVLIFNADKLMVTDIFQKIRVYLISRLYLNRENLMLAKYTRLTVVLY